MEFKPLKLSDDRFEIAPKFTIELNPEEAGKRSHVYFVWPFSPEAYPDIPSLDSVIQEEVPRHALRIPLRQSRSPRRFVPRRPRDTRAPYRA